MAGASEEGQGPHRAVVLLMMMMMIYFKSKTFNASEAAGKSMYKINVVQGVPKADTRHPDTIRRSVLPTL